MLTDGQEVTEDQQSKEQKPSQVGSGSQQDDSNVFDSSEYTTEESEVDTEFVPQGDDSLPWRQPRQQGVLWKRGGSRDRSKQRDRSLSSSRQEVKPWNEEAVRLKRAPIKPKEIEKETLESVELKPSKTVKRDIPREQLESVQLRRVSIDKNVESLRQDEVEDRTKQTEDISILEITQQIDNLIRKDIETNKQFKDKRQDTEETNLLRLDKRTDEEETDFTKTKEESVPWKRGPKSRDTSLDKRTHTEDTTLLEVKKREDVSESTQGTPVPWKRGPKSRETSLDKRTHIEDKTICDVQQVTTEETQEAPVTWKRGPRSRSRDLSAEKKHEELIPWNQEGVKLRPSVRQPKQLEKETLETIELKPTKIIKKEVVKETIDQVDLKRFKTQKTQEPEVIDTSQKTIEDIEITNLDKQVFQETVDTSLLDVRSRTEENELTKKSEEVPVLWKRGVKPKDASLDKQSHIEDASLLDVREREEETVQDKHEEAPVLWKRGPKHKKPEAESLSYVEDQTLLHDRQVSVKNINLFTLVEKYINSKDSSSLTKLFT